MKLNAANLPGHLSLLHRDPTPDTVCHGWALLPSPNYLVGNHAFAGKLVDLMRQQGKPVDQRPLLKGIEPIKHFGNGPPEGCRFRDDLWVVREHRLTKAVGMNGLEVDDGGILQRPEDPVSGT